MRFQRLFALRSGFSRTSSLLAGLAAAALVAAAIAIPLSLGGGTTTSRPGFQRILDSLVSGPQRVAPGATAYVFGPHGTWIGSAGIANVKTGQKMWPDARLRIQSLSKAWLLAVTLQLAQEGKLSLSDTVARWLPGLLPYGSKITILELETDTSGLIDDNTMAQDPARYLARVKDATLREQLEAIAARLRANPNTPVDPIWLIRLAAWQPLLFTPGLRYSHSNIGWNIAGMIVARAAGQSLPTLYRDRIFKPLGLTHTSYQPQGPIAGPHAEGYQISANGTLTDTTAWTFGKGADGAIVTDAADEATFLRATVDNQLHIRQAFLLFYGWTGGKQARCPGHAFQGVGAGAASWAYAYYNAPASRIAVLLLNGRLASSAGKTTEPKAAAAAASLYCNA
jgi:D-alanyl-D-alanine carboxypeptidase